VSAREINACPCFSIDYWAAGGFDDPGGALRGFFLLPQLGQVIRNKSKHLKSCSCKGRAYIVQSKIHPPFYHHQLVRVGVRKLEQWKNKLMKFYKFFASSWVLYAPERPLALGPCQKTQTILFYPPLFYCSATLIANEVKVIRAQ
jgi:hypothetical protein